MKMVVDGLRIKTLGGLSIERDGEVVDSFASRKAEALLVYLACNPRTHPREVLADLLWDDRSQRQAMSNLRVVLSSLRRQVGPYVSISRTTAAANVQEDMWLDATRLEAAVETIGKHDGVDSELGAEALAEALSLYEGDFLEGFFVSGATGFQTWASGERERLHRLCVDGLRRLAGRYLGRGEYGAAIAAATRQVQIDPLAETGHRQLMEALAHNGQRAEALAQYDTCQQILEEELSMAPANRTTQYYEKILAGDLRFDHFPREGIRGYELKEPIGEGSYGATYRAVQPAIKRQVAIKVIRRKYANDPHFIRRFEAEAQTIARLEHPYIVPLYDYWRDPQGAYLVMRYIDGGSLLSELNGGPWDAQRTARMVDQIADALSIAHRQGIVHRDIKPGNILLDSAGSAYLADFGIAKDLTGERHFTAEGAVVGTLYYVSPEQILGEAITPQSDIYSLGVVLYEILTGERPFGKAPVAELLHSQLHKLIPLVAATRPDVPAEVDAVLQKATAKQPSERYGTAPEMAAAFRSAVRGLQPEAMPESIPALVEAYNPYKGLHAFQESDADDFFGREVLVQELVDRLRVRANGQEPRFLALIGPSGSGKSSAIKAGLIPALRDGALPGSEKWFITEMVPGTNPLNELEQALWRVAVDPPPDLVASMRRDTGGILRTIRRILPTDTTLQQGSAQLLLVVDQFEELFTLVEDEGQRAFFLDSLLAAMEAPRSPLRVVVTLRADLYDRPLQYQEWGQLLKQNTEIVLPLNRMELIWAIREPARRMGVRLEDGLAADIVADVADQPGALPLLQYAMTELFDRREERCLSRGAYEELGGVQGALGRRAEALYGELSQRGQEIARQLFLRLVTLGQGSEDTRRRVPRSELVALTGKELSDEEHASPLTEVLDRFGAARFLTFDRDPLTRAPTVEVAHEALLREWSHLRRWLAESRDDMRLQRSLAQAAGEWLRADRDPGYLLLDARLDHFAGWAETTSLSLTAEEWAFIGASVTVTEKRLAVEEERHQREMQAALDLADEQQKRAEEQARAAQRLRRSAVYLAGALAVSASNAALATSRELSLAALNNLDVNPELSILLAVEALSTANTAEAQHALHAAVLGSRIRQRLIAHDASIVGAAYSLDGTLIAINSSDGTASVWNVNRGERLFQVPVNLISGIVALQITFSRDGTRLVTVDPGETLSLSVWAASTGQLLETLSLPVEIAGIANYSLHPEWTQLALGYKDGSVAVWDLINGQLAAELPGHDEFVEPFYSPDGGILATASGDKEQKILIWDAATFTLSRSLETGAEPIFVTMSPDGRWLAHGDLNNAVHLWDLEAPGDGMDQTPFAILNGHGGFVFALAFSPDSQRIASAGLDATARLWDISTGENLLTLGQSAPLYTLAFQPDGDRLLAGDMHGNTLVWDLTPSGSAERLAWTGHSAMIRAASLGMDGSRLATASLDGTVRIWNLATGRELLLLDGHLGSPVMGVAFHPDDRRLATASTDGTARVWDGETGQELLRLEGHGEGSVGNGLFEGVMGLSYSPDGQRLATAGADGTARIWDSAMGDELLVLEGHTGGLTRVVYSSNGRYLASGGEDANVRIWSAETGQQLFAFSADHGEQLWGLDFSADGRFLATSGSDTMARVWSLDIEGREAELLATITGHVRTVTAVRFSPDGQVLATAAPGFVRLWDISGLHDNTGGSSLTELLALPGGPAVAFNEDGSELLVGDRQGLLRVYLLDPDELMALARERLTRWWTLEECQRFLHQETCPEE